MFFVYMISVFKNLVLNYLRVNLVQSATANPAGDTLAFGVIVLGVSFGRGHKVWRGVQRGIIQIIMAIPMSILILSCKISRQFVGPLAVGIIHVERQPSFISHSQEAVLLVPAKPTVVARMIVVVEDHMPLTIPCKVLIVAVVNI